MISIDGRWSLSTELHDLVEQLVERTEIESAFLDRVVATDGFQSWALHSRPVPGSVRGEIRLARRSSTTAFVRRSPVRLGYPLSSGPP